MANIIIDRRQTDKGKSTVNRQKYLKRVKDQVREAVRKTITDGSIGDIVDPSGKKIRIPGKGLSQPTFRRGSGGHDERVYPGNKEFSSGDRLPRPKKGGGDGAGGKQASDSGEGEDDFEFHLTQEEFMDLFFEDLELPDLIKTSITKIDEWKNRRAGFSVDGAPSRLNVLRTLKQAKGRRAGLRSPKRKKLKELEAQLQTLLDLDVVTSEDQEKIKELEQEIARLKVRIANVPFIDDIDLRYNRWERVPQPATQAVMVAIMDVSGSMQEWEKEMAKRFFMCLYLFLHRDYDKIDIIFIRHTTFAKEVDEDEFFHSRETGGTLVSSSLELMQKILDERYPTDQWNRFGCQASDGDNWPADSVLAQNILRKMLPTLQYYAYVEINKRPKGTSDLWPYYEPLANHFANFKMSIIDDATKIYPVFRGLFERGVTQQ